MSLEQEQLDATEEMVESIDKLRDDIRASRPVINVQVPIQPVPQIKVEPKITVEVPKQEKPSVVFSPNPTAYECKITSRDGNGDIKTFTMTPIS